ncbi:MAG: polysaccharide pyruvyl transferase family protein [Eubacterium sp.]|nr:polysaccharide pyruvyl transferase family protein [Eubacterium sp.]
MKIGILTFHRSENYGSVLQAYSLCRALETLGKNEIEIIDYSNEHQRELYSVFVKNNSVKNAVKNARSLLNISQLRRRKAAFGEFINSLPLSSERFNNDAELRSHKSEYDLIICGSDQIWNPQSVDFSLSFFGVDFNCKKAAYAPSIRNARTEDFSPYAEEIKKAIKDFKRVSLREKNSIPVFQPYCDAEIECVCDPTLLLDAGDFDEIRTDNSLPDDYIFYYSIDYNARSVEMVRHISKALGKPVCVIFSGNKTYNVFFKGFKLAENNAPGDFINLIKNASLVLSTSFHGVALSVIYRKPFFALKTRDYTDARINDLLNEIGLDDRYIDFNGYKELDFSAPVNYDGDKIRELRENSLGYLKRCLYD